MDSRSSLGDVSTSTTADLRALEARTLEHPAVLDVAVMRRTDRTGEPVVVAYVVGVAPLTLEDLRAHVSASGISALPDALVRVSGIPLSAEGRVDERALASVAVIDDDAIERYRYALQSTSEVAAADVVSTWQASDEATLRVDELLPGWSPLPAQRAAKQSSRAAPKADAAPSMSVGEPIVWRADSPRRLADLLSRAARQFPLHGVTCIEQGSEQTIAYPELEERAERIMAGLRAAGVRPGDIAIFQLDHNRDFVAAFWGCVLGGFVPAPISVSIMGDPSSPAATKLRNAWQLLGNPYVLTSAELEPSLVRLKHALEIPDLRTLTIEQLSQSLPGEPRHEAEPDDLALLLLTSGSTGRPKAVTQTQGALVAYTTGVIQRHGFTPDDVSLNWFPLDHVGGIVMFHLRDVAMACNQIQVRTDYILQDALRWLDLIDRFRATITWAPNFAYALVNDRSDEVAARTWDLSSMAFILNAGEAIVAATARRFLKRLMPHGLPATAMRPSWGMSETCSAETFAPPFRLESTSDDDEFVVVGSPNPGFEIRIVNDEHHVVPEGFEGHLEVRGPCVTRGYLNNPEVNATAFAADGWFRTGDLGRLVSGGLTITGREKGEIIVNGVNYPAHEVESAVEDVAGVTATFTAAFAVREQGVDTDSLAIAFHTSREKDAELTDLLRRIRQTVLERVGVVPRFMLRVAQEDIPKTAIGKIQRSALTKRFADGGFAPAIKRSEQLTQRAETIPDWFFRPVWRKRSSVPHRPLGPGCVVLIVADRRGVAAALEPLIRDTGARAAIAESQDIEQLIAGVSARERLVVMVGDRYGVRPTADTGDEPALALAAAESVIRLVRSLARQRSESAPSELIVYDDRTQHVAAGDQTVVGKASVLGILKTIPSEHPEISVRHVDMSDGRPEELARLLVAEIADRRDESEVAYRKQQRWVRRLTNQPARPDTRGYTLGKTDGFYLVTGGLGGVGAELGRYLLRSTGVPLLLVGRRPIDGATDQRAATLASLQSLGTVQFEAVDVADLDALDTAVASATKRFGRPLAGVIHLAGVFEPRLLLDETAETLAAALRAKVQGAWSIHNLLLPHPTATLLAFSSVNGQLGGYAAGAYATANAFVDSLVAHHVAELGRTAHSLGWSLWDAVGISREYALKDSAVRRGYRAVSAQQGIISLAAGTGSEPGHLLIGLDGSNPHVRRYVDDAPVSEMLTARWVRQASADPVMPSSLDDRFGVSIPRTVREVKDLDHASGGDSADASFGNEVERVIATVWREVLSTGHIGPNENFFDAGGTSLLVATASRKLQEALGRAVAMTDIYRFPTLRLLAAQYAGESNADSTELDSSEERGKARRAQRLQRRRRTP